MTLHCLLSPGAANIACGINCLRTQAHVQELLQLVDASESCAHHQRIDIHRLRAVVSVDSIRLRRIVDAVCLAHLR